jgi:hypothetical protein
MDLEQLSLRLFNLAFIRTFSIPDQQVSALGAARLYYWHNFVSMPLDQMLSPRLMEVQPQSPKILNEIFLKVAA